MRKMMMFLVVLFFFFTLVTPGLGAIVKKYEPGGPQNNIFDTNPGSYSNICRDYGPGRETDNMSSPSFIYNEYHKKFFIGTVPNGHLLSYNPYDATYNPNQLWDYGKTRDDDQENYIWTLCCDSDGIVYGGTCQSGPAEIFAYDPGLDDMEITRLTGYDFTFLWCSANSDSFVYFGAEDGAGGKLLQYNKATHSVTDIFASLSYQYNQRAPFTKEFVEAYDNAYYQHLIWKNPGYIGELAVRSLTTGPGGKIYGGTYHGYIFAYDPASNTMEFLNVNEMANPYIDTLSWGFGGVLWPEANDSLVFAAVLGSDSVGVFQLDFSSNSPVRKLYYNDQILHGMDLKIIEDTLYICNWGVSYNYSISSGVVNTMNFPGEDYVSYTDSTGANCLVSIYPKDETIGVNYYRIGQSGSIFSTGNLTISNAQPLANHPRYRSIAADTLGVYGGLYFTGDFVHHEIENDFSQNNTVNGIGRVWGANADAAIAYGSYIYYGWYSEVGLGIYNPRTASNINGQNFGYYGTPWSGHNPLLRHLKLAGYGDGHPTVHTISDDALVRVNCITSAPSRDMLYIGTGPRALNKGNAGAWVISFHGYDGYINHLCQLDSTGLTNLQQRIDWIEDIASYNYSPDSLILFVVGKNPDSLCRYDRIVTIRVSSAGVPSLLHQDTISANNVLVDASHNKVYISMNYPYSYQYKIYNLTQVIQNGFSGVTPTTGYAPSNLTILELILGNDGAVYAGYGDYIGKFTASSTIKSVAYLNPANHGQSGAYRMTASLNLNNYHIYIGDLNGHMYGVFPENFVMITSPDSAIATEDTYFSYLATASSVDSLTPTISFQHVPSWMTAAGNTIHGTPLEANHDTSFTIIAHAGVSSDTMQVAVHVIQVNDPPVIISPSSDTANWPGTFSYTATATDPENNSITYNYISHPSWLTHSGATISGTVPGTAADTSFRVTASDSQLADTLIVSLHIGRSCNLVAGDVNCNGTTNGIDVTFLRNYFTNGTPVPPCTCYCPSALCAGADANGNCVLNGIDLTYLVSHFSYPYPPCLKCTNCQAAKQTISEEIPEPATQPIQSPFLKLNSKPDIGK